MTPCIVIYIIKSNINMLSDFMLKTFKYKYKVYVVCTLLTNLNSAMHIAYLYLYKITTKKDVAIC